MRNILLKSKRLIWEKSPFPQGDSPMIMAVKRKNLSMVKLLLSIEESVVRVDTDYGGNSPLHWAVKMGSKEIAKILIEHGALINQGDNWGKTPLALAQEIGNKDMIEFLKSRGATEKDFEEMIIEAARLGDYSSLKGLLDKGMDVNTRVPNGCCLIHYAAESGKTDVVQLLLDRGANVNDVAPGSQLTPLHNAASEGHLEMVKFLVSKGADRKLKHYTGQTPSEMARERGHPEIADYLDGPDSPKQ